MRIRWIGLLATAGCLSQLTAATTPEPAVGTEGTLACGAIVETCTSQCNDPLCVEGCKSHGNPQAQQVYGVLVDCAKANRCFDEGCLMASCQPEVDACKADGVPASTPAATTSGTSM